MTAASEWRVEIRAGDAASLHAWGPPDRPSRVVRVLEVDRPALVLGSGQRQLDIDDRTAAAAGIEVVRRGSGGGAVLLVPGEHVWFDVWLPAADPLWVDDVVEAAGWLGEAWARVASGLGLDPVVVHLGPVSATKWSALVCFAGRGPGEVFVGDEQQKLTGVSQRRTREWVRMQVMVHRRWDAAATFRLLVGDPAVRRDAVEAHATTVAVVGEADVTTGFVDTIRSIEPPSG